MLDDPTTSLGLLTGGAAAASPRTHRTRAADRAGGGNDPAGVYGGLVEVGAALGYGVEDAELAGG